ncbi:MAG: ATP-binding cassette domain-containing protein [Burkholderiaceae bacterium]
MTELSIRSADAPPTDGPEVLAAHGFGAAFGDKVVLAEVDLVLPPHTLTVLLGPVGMGKSTLLRAIAGLNDRNPRYRSWGHVDYQGQPLADDHRPALVVKRQEVVS